MNIMQIMKQAQELQDKVQRMQTELEGVEIEGQAGAGSVRITLDGRSTVKASKPSSISSLPAPRHRSLSMQPRVIRRAAW